MADNTTAPPAEQLENLHLDPVTGEKVNASLARNRTSTDMSTRSPSPNSSVARSSDRRTRTRRPRQLLPLLRPLQRSPSPQARRISTLDSTTNSDADRLTPFSPRTTPTPTHTSFRSHTTRITLSPSLDTSSPARRNRPSKSALLAVYTVVDRSASSSFTTSEPLQIPSQLALGCRSCARLRM